MLSKKILSDIENKSKEFNDLKPLSFENQQKLDKKFRLEFNYNSNHLEGNTLTYGETELLLIFDQTEGTHDFREYEEMQAHDVALKMIKEEAEDKDRPLTESFIRNINEKLLVKPFWKDAITQDGQPTRKQIIPGKYKTTPNSVRLANGEIFHYAAPADVEREMTELVAWFNENDGKENPVLLASLLHYKFVRIHPFDDGNGRTARLLMNYVLLRNDLPLVIIKSEAKNEYLAALNRADVGDINSFCEYIGKQLFWSLNISIRAAKGDDIEEENDLDKELELLKQNLKKLPNEFDKKKSYKEIALIVDKSVIPLFRELQAKIDKISDLFVSIQNHLHLVTFTNNIALKVEMRYDNDYLVMNEANFFKDLYEQKILKIFIEIYFEALKKSNQKKDILYNLNFNLDEFHYIIYDTAQKRDLVKLPYGRFLSKTQINTIVKSVMSNIIEEIKLSTNLD